MGSDSPRVESKKRLGIPLVVGSLGSTHLAVFRSPLFPGSWARVRVGESCDKNIVSFQVGSQVPGFILGGIGWESEEPSLLLPPSQFMTGVSHE